MDNSLGKKVTVLSLIKYTFPTIMMMMFFSLYTIIDGMFISRFVNADALSATNIVYPAINILLELCIRDSIREKEFIDSIKKAKGM